MHSIRRTMIHDGRERHVTEVACGEHVETLILFLHGSLQSGRVARNFTARTFDHLVREGTTVVYPDGIGRHFNDLRRDFAESARTLSIDDVGFLTTLVESYNPDRVIACGFSNGGQMLLRMLFQAPGLLNGVALFGASMPTDDNLISPLAPRPTQWVPTPILTVQGTADPIVAYEGGLAGIGANNRGTTRSAGDSARLLAQLNNATEHAETWPHENVRVDTFSGDERNSAPVELWSIHGMGHMVPVPRPLDERLGPGTETVIGAELVRDFFDLEK